jgi:hypothetical protein
VRLVVPVRQSALGTAAARKSYTARMRRLVRISRCTVSQIGSGGIPQSRHPTSITESEMSSSSSVLNRRNFLRVAGGGVIASAATLPLAGCSLSGDNPPEAVAAWQGPQGDSGDVRRWILSYAILAQPQVLQQHRAIASEAWRIELVTPRTIMESYKVLRVGPREIAQHRDGLSINTPMARAFAALGLFDRSKAPGPQDMATTGQIKDFNAKIAATPAFFWLVTQGNDRKTQVNAGRAYARAQLAATAQGLSMQPLSQALQEYPEQARPYAQIHALLQAPPPRYTVQMWSRLGYAPPVGPAPRRGVDAHIMNS